MSTYQINGLSKFFEQDDWEKGCLPHTGGSFEVTGHWTGNTPGEVVQKVKDFLGAGDDDVLLDSCEEPGQVEFQLLEDDDSTVLSPAQIAEWKEGKLRAWAATYTGYVERVDRVALTPETETPAQIDQRQAILVECLKNVVARMDENTPPQPKKGDLDGTFRRATFFRDRQAARDAIAVAETPAQPDPRMAGLLEALDVLKHILRAHDTKNNGAVNGEAKLCEHFAESARAAIAQAEWKAQQ